MTNNQLAEKSVIQLLNSVKLACDNAERADNRVDHSFYYALTIALEELQERRKAERDSEPVILYRQVNPANGMKTYWAELDQEEFRHLKKYTDENAEFMTLYRHAQPAPVVPEEKPIPNTLSMYAVDAVAAIAEVKGWNACRAAMLQAEPVTTDNKLADDFDFDRFNDVTWLECVASNPHMHSPTTSTIARVALELNKRIGAGNSPAQSDCCPAQNVVAPAQSPIDHGYLPECECSGCKATARICTEMAVNSLVIPNEMTSEQAYEIGYYYGDPVDVFARGANWMRQHIIDSTLAAAPQLPGSEPATVPGKWIPVSERMPPSRHEVLVGRWWGEKLRWCCKWARYIPGHPDAQSSGWLIPGASWTPTHWMPLPAAPQEVR
ncbi:DUF551 domain-containing protein [Klebsiella pneumoniae]